MELKAPDSKQTHIDALKQLLLRTDLTSSQRERIETEIRTAGAGLNAEKQAVYEIEFHLGKRSDYMTLHDVRLEWEGRVAQIDHLIINQYFDFWVCESKSYQEGVEINEDGEWMYFYQGRARGMESPLHQNDRHVAVLRDVLAGHVRTPTRLGTTRVPALKGIVLFSNRTNIKRPTDRTKVAGLDRVMKLDQLIESLEHATELRRTEERGRAMSQARVEGLARRLATLHRPATWNWNRKFGLAETEASAVSGQRATCTSCGTSVSMKVVAYCRDNASVFDGRLLCPFCQYQVRRNKSVMHYA